MGNDIFLSYSRADKNLADQFVKIASARGLNVWYDRLIKGGQDWRGGIVDALSQSNALVILFSESSNSSRQLIKELALADNLSKLVIPVLIEQTEPRGAYLYEMASREWINLYPNPELHLEPLVEKLKIQLGSKPENRLAPSIQEQEPRPTTDQPERTILPQSGSESWFPLGRYDLFVLAPILFAGFVWELNGKGQGLAFSMIAFFCYMLVIGVRNARLNRSIFSLKSFASYFVVGAVGLAPALISSEAEKAPVNAGAFFAGEFLALLILAFLIALVANILQAVLRKIFQQNIFRRRVEKPFEPVSA